MCTDLVYRASLTMKCNITWQIYDTAVLGQYHECAKCLFCTVDSKRESKYIKTMLNRVFQ